MTPAGSERLRRAVRFSFWAICVWSVVVLAQWRLATDLRLGTTDWGFNIYYYLVLHHEPIAWCALLLCVVASCAALAAGGDGSRLSKAAEALERPRWRVVLCAVLFVVLALANHAIYHRYPFSMDEFAPLFQAKIFLSGAIKATIPEAWREYGNALTPVFIRYDPADHSWTSNYLPVHAALQAMFLALGASDYLNPLLGASSVLLMADVARLLFPEQRSAPLVAAALLITSAQFLVTSISYYSMPAHLCANLLWLSLYLRNTRWSLALAPWIGGLALGLHQLVVHALFVFPFLLRLVYTRRVGASAYFAAVYLGFIGLWHWWWQAVSMSGTPVQHAAAVLRPPGFVEFLTQSNNLTLILSWQSAAGALLLLLAIFYVGRMPGLVRDLLIGLAATFLLYAFYKDNQGHGWGYRYIYGVLGNLVLLATFGWTCMAEGLGRAKALRAVLVSSLLAVLLQLPLRAYQVENVLRPFAAARDYLAGLRDEVVVVDYRSVWYGQDLVRNDPFLSDGPIVLHLVRLTRPTRRGPTPLDRARLVRPKDLADLGMIVSGPPPGLQSASARRPELRR